MREAEQDNTRHAENTKREAKKTISKFFLRLSGGGAACSWAIKERLKRTRTKKKVSGLRRGAGRMSAKIENEGRHGKKVTLGTRRYW